MTGAALTIGGSDLQQGMLLATCTVAGALTATVQIDGADTVNTCLVTDGVSLQVGDRCLVVRVGSQMIAVDAFTDTNGPVNNTLIAGVTGNISWRARGGYVTVEGSPAFASLAVGTSKPLVAAGDIPARYRPLQSFWRPGGLTNTLASGIQVQVGSDGSIAAYNGTTAAITTFGFSLVYPMK